jgi:hypothetical protein
MWVDQDFRCHRCHLEMAIWTYSESDQSSLDPTANRKLHCYRTVGVLAIRAWPTLSYRQIYHLLNWGGGVSSLCNTFSLAFLGSRAASVDNVVAAGRDSQLGRVVSLREESGACFTPRVSS